MKKSHVYMCFVCLTRSQLDQSEDPEVGGIFGQRLRGNHKFYRKSNNSIQKMSS